MRARVVGRASRNFSCLFGPKISAFFFVSAPKLHGMMRSQTHVDSLGRLAFRISRRLSQCGGCVSKGETALKSVPGVREATINLATSTATVTLDGKREGSPTLSSTFPAFPRKL